MLISKLSDALFKSGPLSRLLPAAGKKRSKQSTLVKKDVATKNTDTTKSNSANTKRKTDVGRWLSVSLDILEQNFLILIINPFIKGILAFVFLIIAFIGIGGILLGYVYINNFYLLINQTFIAILYTIFASASLYLGLFLHSIITKQRLKTIHEIIPHQKSISFKSSNLYILAHDLIFIGGVFALALAITGMGTMYYFTLFLVGFSVLIVLFRTLFRYVLGLIYFEEYSFFGAIKESISIFISSDLKIINHTILPILCVFGLGIASIILVEQTDWKSSIGLIILAIYSLIYYVYYFFFGFTVDYLAYIYARIKLRIKPKVYSRIQPKRDHRALKLTTISALVLLPLFVFSGILASSESIVFPTQKYISRTKLKNEQPVTVSGSTNQPFALNDTIRYRGIEFKVNSVNLVKIDNSAANQICMINITLKNFFSGTLEFYPHLSINVFDLSNGVRFNNFEDNNPNLSDKLVLDPYAKYLIAEGTKINGSLPFDCSSLVLDESNSRQSGIRLEYLMTRVESQTQEPGLSIKQYLDYQNQSKTEEYKNAKTSIVINAESFDSRNISQNLPLELNVLSVQPVMNLETRYCKVNFEIINHWKSPVTVEFYMISLTDGNGIIRPQAYLSRTFDQNASLGIVPSSAKGVFTQEFNCQDGSSVYSLNFTPYIDFGPFINQKTISAPVNL